MYREEFMGLHTYPLAYNRRDIRSIKKYLAMYQVTAGLASIKDGCQVRMLDSNSC